MGNVCKGEQQEFDLNSLNLTKDIPIKAQWGTFNKMTDPTVSFGYMFPFRRMSLETLDYKLQTILSQ